MTKEYRLMQIAKLVAVFRDTPNGELPPTAEQLNKWVVKLARKCLDGKSPHEALNTFVQRLTAKDSYLLRQLALDLLQQVAASQKDAEQPMRAHLLRRIGITKDEGRPMAGSASHRRRRVLQ